MGESKTSYEAAQRDIITGGIVIAATILFIWTGGRAMSQAVQEMVGMGTGVEQVLMTAVLLNVALILFGYRRYRDLKAEVARRANAEERARSLAATDPLTGFLNRRSLMEETSQLIANTRTHPGQVVAAMILDLDHFKTVNDVHGHAAGDAVLKTVAARIGETLPPGALVARLGGDEFACAIIFDAADADMIDRALERLIANVVVPVDYEAASLTVSASLGVARSDHDGDQIETLLRRADIAMYVAKAQGRNRFVWFNGAMEKELHFRSSIEANMRRGIPRGEFLPYYEQQVDLTTGRLLGFEMLARWENAELGSLLPEVFIPVAEETGMIGDLSMSVMRQAFLDAKSWDPELTLSVNISPAQLKDPWLSQKILKLLTETGFPARRLEIEITESSLFENLPLAQSIVASLKAQGIRIALDDFGTGYSSLAHLRALPFDRIKIDRSFIMSMTENQESAAIVQAIARLAESLGLPVTAEGIESGHIEEQLRELGLVKGQGWHFGKPMSVEQARKLLAERDMIVGGKAKDNSRPDVAIEALPTARLA